MKLFAVRNTTLTCLLTFLLFHFISKLSGQTTLDLKKALLTAELNSGLKAKKKNIQVAEADVVTSGLRPNPLLNNQSLQLMDPDYFPPLTAWNNGRNRQIWWQLTKPLLLPGVRQNRVDFATTNMRQQEYLYEDAERELMFQVAGKWIDAWLGYKRLISFEQAAARLHVNEKKTVTSLETDLMVRENKLLINNAESELLSELKDLQVLLGSAEKIEIDTNVTSIIQSFQHLDSVLGNNFSARPDLQYFKGSVESSIANIKLQKSNSLPVPEIGFIYNPQNTIPYLGFFGTLQIPIFARNQGEIQKSRVLKLQAEDFLTYQTFKTNQEIAKAVENYRFSKSYLHDYGEVLAISTSILAARRENQESENLQKDHLERQIQYYEALANFIRSSVQLLYVTGNLKNFALKN